MNTMDLQIIFIVGNRNYAGIVRQGGIIRYENRPYYNVKAFAEDVAKEYDIEFYRDTDHNKLIDYIYFSEGHKCINICYNDMCKYIYNHLKKGCNRLYNTNLLCCIHKMWNKNKKLMEDALYWLHNQENEPEFNNVISNKIDELKNKIFDKHYDFDTQQKISIITKMADIMEDISSIHDPFTNEKVDKLENYINNNKNMWSRDDKINMVNNLTIIIKNLMSDIDE